MNLPMSKAQLLLDNLIHAENPIKAENVRRQASTIFKAAENTALASPIASASFAARNISINR